MGAEPVIVLYASISVLNWMRAATGSQCKDTKRGVNYLLLEENEKQQLEEQPISSMFHLTFCSFSIYM